jgi:hypothetical protein
VDRIDDLGRVDALQVGAGDTEVRVSKLALDDWEWHTFTSRLDRMGVAKLVRRKAPPDACRGREPPQLGSCAGL